REKCGCTSLVEHLLAKEDVARSTLVTRASAEMELPALQVQSSSVDMKTTSLLPCAFVAALLIHAAHVRAANEPKDTTPWKITGQLDEACSCDAACPC